MSEASIDVSPLALSILQLLDERPMHPYELAATMRERHQDEFIRLNFGSLYHTVDMLELEHKIAMLEAERKWVRKIADEISEGRLEWSTGTVHGLETLRRRHGTGAH